jgi:excisionase family DNA binding protein
MVNAAEPPMLLTVPQVADHLGISRERAYELIAAGALPVVRLGKRRTRVPRAALQEWITAQIEPAKTSSMDRAGGDR